MALCFVADENIETEIVDALRELGYEATHIACTAPGLSDEVILDSARRRGCILITHDKDFGGLVFQQKRITAGVVVLRLPGMDPTKKAELVCKAVLEHADRLPGSYTVLRPRAIRVRTNL